MMNKHFYGVIVAGGIGSRFWPLSTKENPKQFHDILNKGKTLLQSTFGRLSKLVPIENIYCVASSIYREKIQKQLPDLKEENILIEPLKKNTAPALVFAAFEINSKDENASLIVTPSDHLIENEQEFSSLGTFALEQAKNTNRLITLGIEPSRPDTGYGYIEYMPENGGRIKKVKKFTEKPDYKTAISFLKRKNHLWNAGIFVWSTKSFLNSIEEYAPNLFKAFQPVYKKSKERTLQEAFEVCDSISIDFALLEKANNVFVLPANIGWSDIGTWNSLYELLDKDSQKNTILGVKPFAYSSSGNVICTEKKVVVLDGLNDMIVVDTKNSLLICSKANEQAIKFYVEQITNS